MELERDALLVYLSNIRTLETLLYENNRTDKSLDSKRLELEEEYRKKKEDKPVEPVKAQEDSSGDKFRRGVFYTVIIAVGALMIFIGFHLGGFSGVCIGGFGACMVVWTLLFMYSNSGVDRIIKDISERQEKDYEINIENYNKEISELEIKTNTYKEKISSAKGSIKADINKTQQLLNKAYDLNIIPLQFRNIEGVYYLYDYLSTSNESLTSALMQANLESIKSKLDQVIKMQGAMIIQQAQANKAIFKQNEKILASMKNVEQYSKISAINSEIAVKLSAKQLAYQKAEFWLR